MGRAWFLILGVFWSLVGIVAQAGEPAVDAVAVRNAVEHALKFVEARGVEWIEQRGCVTCHQTTFLIWSHRDARRAGFDVDARKLNEWTNWALGMVVSASEGGASQGADTLSQLLLSRDTAKESTWMRRPSKGDRTADPYENVLKHLLAAQQDDGHWEPGGQSQNPGEIGTAWALLAMAARDGWMTGDGTRDDPRKSASTTLTKLIKQNDEAMPKARERGLAYLKKMGDGSPRAVSLNEWYVVRVLMEKRIGEPALVKGRVDGLLAKQNKDGGWSVLVAKDGVGRSDAFATGQSLYALGVAGVGRESEAVRRGLTFLLKTQREDGGWTVPAGTFHAATTKPARNASLEGVYVHWGTAWAALGMLASEPERGRR